MSLGFPSSFCILFCNGFYRLQGDYFIRMHSLFRLLAHEIRVKSERAFDCSVNSLAKMLQFQRLQIDCVQSSLLRQTLTPCDPYQITAVISVATVVVVAITQTAFNEFANRASVPHNKYRIKRFLNWLFSVSAPCSDSMD